MTRTARLQHSTDKFHADVDAAVAALEGPDPRDAVIARLLDGWHPAKADDDEDFLVWFGRSYYPQGLPDEWRDAPEEPMSDGEAAIIRAHTEAT